MSIAGYSEQQINATPKVFFGERMLRQTLEFIKSTDLKEEAKQALAAYCVFSAFGLEKAATILGITVFQLKKYIDIVHSDNNLIAIFDTLYPEDAEDELREEDGEEVS
jgi:hypothetical protein